MFTAGLSACAGNSASRVARRKVADMAGLYGVPKRAAAAKQQTPCAAAQVVCAASSGVVRKP